jgi:hypothetical protein
MSHDIADAVIDWAVNDAREGALDRGRCPSDLAVRTVRFDAPSADEAVYPAPSASSARGSVRSGIEVAFGRGHGRFARDLSFSAGPRVLLIAEQSHLLAASARRGDSLVDKTGHLTHVMDFPRGDSADSASRRRLTRASDPREEPAGATRRGRDRSS